MEISEIPESIDLENVNIDATSGDVQIPSLEAQKMTIDVVSGDIRVTPDTPSSPIVIPAMMVSMIERIHEKNTVRTAALSIVAKRPLMTVLFFLFSNVPDLSIKVSLY